ncbi:type II toxin-antitoxin system VapC family toxin [Ciceribacter sp. L1K22]|uniref:type II toxin-antitoxin system VapC family toxin n=1 Tax=Ciceribacter sp. L1K22 TaxID=2820275 RepID=UPI001ABE3921|nr:type II toxin-antitoxin system VapC family toxin [Ciceribacter sp. L1K22]MBO3760131.1 type II toxin-antitoxin system VapC family toxin [Ciceribacter sp. L1K22]
MADLIYLMDTNVISNAGLKQPPPGLHSWLKAVGAGSLAISFPLISELRRGAHLASKHDPQKGVRLHKWIDDILSVSFRMADMTDRAADLYAEMTTIGPLRHLYLSHQSQRKDQLGHDLMFAALSIAHQMPIVSFDVDDFLLIDQYFSLPGVFQPLEEKWHVPCRILLEDRRTVATPPTLPEFVAGGFSFLR